MLHRRARIDKTDRRRQIVNATVSALARHGAGKASVRLIAVEAGISPGLITHHFGSIEFLVAAACLQLGEVILEALDHSVANADGIPERRLASFVEACFRSPIMDREIVAGWLAVTGLSQSMPPVAQAHRQVVARLRDRVSALLPGVASREEAAVLASGTVAVLEGLWLEMACDLNAVSAEEAKGLVQRWLRSFPLCRDDME